MEMIPPAVGILLPRTPRLGNTTQNWIGRSQLPNDTYLDGNPDDFCIYNRALSSAEVATLASLHNPSCHLLEEAGHGISQEKARQLEHKACRSDGMDVLGE